MAADAPPERDAPPHPATTLRLVRVEGIDGAERCTIHPQTDDDLTLMSTWLTVDGSAVVDLSAVR